MLKIGFGSSLALCRPLGVRTAHVRSIAAALFHGGEHLALKTRARGRWLPSQAVSPLMRFSL